MTARTLFEKLWSAHVVAEEGGETLLYVDRLLVHDIRSCFPASPRSDFRTHVLCLSKRHASL